MSKTLLERKIENLISVVLDIPVTDVTDSLSYQSTMAWDSLQHIKLIVELGKTFKVKIPNNKSIELINVGTIKQYFKTSNPNGDTELQNKKSNSRKIYRGLNGVYYDDTKITSINGEEGKLLHYGYSIQDLARYSTYEEILYLFLYKELPTVTALESFTEKLRGYRHLDDSLQAFVLTLKDVRPEIALRTTISYCSSFSEREGNTKAKNTIENLIELIAKIPTIITAHHAVRSGKMIIEPRDDLSHSENFLYMLTNVAPDLQRKKIFDADMIIHAEHGSNASAFVSRVVMSTNTDIYAAFSAAISAFGGSLHGGAIASVMEMLSEVKEPENSEKYVRSHLKNGLPIYGFGHRVYRTQDPRAKQLLSLTLMMSELKGDYKGLNILNAIEVAMEEYIEHGMAMNVDFYSGILYSLLEIPEDLFVPIFIASRGAGWAAQILEQKENNILIRPRLNYVGEAERGYFYKKPADARCKKHVRRI